jgi:cytochrome P450
MHKTYIVAAKVLHDYRQALASGMTPADNRRYLRLFAEYLDELLIQMAAGDPELADIYDEIVPTIKRLSDD